MKQPENGHTKHFGNDGPIGNDAEIIVYYENEGQQSQSYVYPFGTVRTN
jgi:hypothetical protein